jgi:pimeloyl-ACP methyl ester carboxylesterase
MTPMHRFILVMSLFAGACSSTGEHIDDVALAAGLSRSVAAGDPFPHVIYANRSAADAQLRELIVFLDGDGRPWSLDGQHPSPDPTTHQPIALELLTRTRAPSVYVSRPCYQQLANARCSPRLWTQARYSEEVVTSMAIAIHHVAEEHASPRLTLVGYSGGGALAELVAERLENVEAVITLAANLDIDAWTRHHEYLPLTESLNPARSERTHPWREMHFQGGHDTNVPAATTDAYFIRYPAAHRELIDAFDHACCWVNVWPSLFARVKEEMGYHIKE